MTATLGLPLDLSVDHCWPRPLADCSLRRIQWSLRSYPSCQTAAEQQSIKRSLFYGRAAWHVFAHSRPRGRYSTKWQWTSRSTELHFTLRRHLCVLLLLLLLRQCSKMFRFSRVRFVFKSTDSSNDVKMLVSPIFCNIYGKDVFIVIATLKNFVYSGGGDKNIRCSYITESLPFGTIILVQVAIIYTSVSLNYTSQR